MTRLLKNEYTAISIINFLFKGYRCSLSYFSYILILRHVPVWYTVHYKDPMSLEIIEHQCRKSFNGLKRDSGQNEVDF